MIKTKKDLQDYLIADKENLGYTKSKPSIFGDEIWKFEITLRKREYYENLQKRNIFEKIMYALYKYKHHKLSIRLGFQVPPNVCGKGLRINHHGLLIISPLAKIGENFDVHAGVNIGVNIDTTKAPTIGNNVFVGPGAKIFGDIYIADNNAISANSVVNHSFYESNITIGGIPAKIINSKRGNPFIHK